MHPGGAENWILHHGGAEAPHNPRPLRDPPEFERNAREKCSNFLEGLFGGSVAQSRVKQSGALCLHRGSRESNREGRTAHGPASGLRYPTSGRPTATSGPTPCADRAMDSLFARGLGGFQTCFTIRIVPREVTMCYETNPRSLFFKRGVFVYVYVCVCVPRGSMIISGACS